MSTLFTYDACLYPSTTQDLTRDTAQIQVPIVASQSSVEKQQSYLRLKDRLERGEAVLLAHYYTEPEIQDLALATQGCVGDSLEMARFGQAHAAQTLIVAGVYFMAETAKILSPEKTVLIAHPESHCSLDLGCPIDDFSDFCDQHPDRVVVVYANTSAAVKARADWVVTSAIALDIVRALHAEGKKILWAPDRHLGAYIQAQTGADMLLWQGSCLVHDEFKAIELQAMMRQHPDAVVLAHPESPAAVLALAHQVGSTSQMIKTARDGHAQTYIVATDQGILHAMRQQAPGKNFLAAPTAGDSASCKSCAFCPWMALNTLQQVEQAFHADSARVTVETNIAAQARISLQRMLDFAAQQQQSLRVSSELSEQQHLFQHVGPA